MILPEIEHVGVGPGPGPDKPTPLGAPWSAETNESNPNVESIINPHPAISIRRKRKHNNQNQNLQHPGTHPRVAPAAARGRQSPGTRERHGETPLQ